MCRAALPSIVGPHLPPRAAILPRLLEQAVILYEAIFPAVGDPVTGVAVQQLVGGALRHVGRGRQRQCVCPPPRLKVPQLVQCGGVKSCMSKEGGGQADLDAHSATVTARACRKYPPIRWTYQPIGMAFHYKDRLCVADRTVRSNITGIHVLFKKSQSSTWNDTHYNRIV